MKYHKILIVGGIGSGKTTLAEKLSKILKIKSYELDNIAYKRRDIWIKADYPERKTKLNKIFKREKWILEGFYSTPWVYSAYKKAEVVIILKINKRVSKNRIIRRFIKRKLLTEKNKFINKNFKDFLKVFKHISEPHYREKLERIHNVAKKYSKKIIILENKRQLNDFLKKLK